MASYDYDLVNLALVRLGANRITSLSDGSKNANEANAIYALIRDDLLREHPWSFATRYENLFRSTKNVLTVSAITKANPGKVTYTGTDPADADQPWSHSSRLSLIFHHTFREPWSFRFPCYLSKS